MAKADRQANIGPTAPTVDVVGTKSAAPRKRLPRGGPAARDSVVQPGSAVAPYSGPIADSDCYTCRRRRVRCDRALDTCRKCTKAGHECAGYKKGFRWVGGIASRGKMMGRSTFDEGHPDEKPPPEQAQQQRQEPMTMTMTMMVVGGSSPSTSGFSNVMADPPQQPYSYETLHFSPGLGASILVSQVNMMRSHSGFEHNGQQDDGDDVLDADNCTIVSSKNTNPLVAAAAAWNNYFAASYTTSPRTGRCHLYEVREYPRYGAAHAACVPISALLEYYVTIPTAAPSLIGSLDARMRYYLSYFDQMCSIFLLFDKHPLNPYRELLLSTLHFPQPALLSTILAVAARYHSNVTGHHAMSSQSADRPDLVYYNQALSYLNADLQDEEKMLEDTTLASVLFFLFYETMDSGLDTWKVHLHGARKLVALKSKRMEMERGPGAVLTHIQAFLLHSIALFDIIGSTLVNNSTPTGLTIRQTPRFISTPISSSLPEDTFTPSAGSETTPASTSTALKPTVSSTISALLSIDKDIYPILVQGENYCFLACPPQILQAILKISTLSNHPYLVHGPTSISPALTMEFLSHRQQVLRDITGFSPLPWLARHTAGMTITAEAQDMWHHVQAYKTAAIIYGYRSLFPPMPTPAQQPPAPPLQTRNDPYDVYTHLSSTSPASSSLPSSSSSPSSSTLTSSSNVDEEFSSGGVTTSTTTAAEAATTLQDDTWTAAAAAAEDHLDVNIIIQALTHDLFTNLDQIPTSSTLYKGTVWPCFIAGTEARTGPQRAKIRRHFELLWKALYCWNVRNGIVALEEMWKSVGEEEGEEGGLEEGNYSGGVGGDMVVGLQRSSNYHHLNNNNYNYNLHRGGRVVEVLDEEFFASAEGGAYVPAGGRWSGVSGAGAGGPWVAPGWEGVFGGGDANGATRSAKNKTSSRGARRKVEQDWKGYLKKKGTEWLFI
ncbi:fungal-specific transcription factor domain-containing protein [Peziza echinospora]|nr:fungal-specific transcription factor domain-containing protein [Peziza echinospora]